LSRVKPGLITGTSTEFLGRRPLRRILRERLACVVFGPKGVGKSAVGLSIASTDGARPLRLEKRAVEDALVHRTRNRAWAPAMLAAKALVLDGSLYLEKRPGHGRLLLELVQARSAAGCRTVICLPEDDASYQMFLDGMPSGQLAVVSLRFPTSRSGRMRVARRVCDELGVSRAYAAATDALDEWTYARVKEEIAMRREADAAAERAAVTVAVEPEPRMSQLA
jgi:hypothetical protein